MGLKNLGKKKWFNLITNTYVLVSIVFLIWMAFFDTNSLLIHRELKKEIKKLEKKQEILLDEIKKVKRNSEKLSDQKEFEKFAREQYYLKKKNEDIYLIEYEDSLKTRKE